MKKNYETPKLQTHGTIQELTQASNQGGFFDQTYPDDSPIPDHGLRGDHPIS